MAQPASSIEHQGTSIEQRASRIETDWLGEKEVPADALYGIQTVRAVENFPISGERPIPEFITALAMVKRAAAVANIRTHRLPEDPGIAIRDAIDEVMRGRWHDQFVVDVFQAGAGGGRYELPQELRKKVSSLRIEYVGAPPVMR